VTPEEAAKIADCVHCPFAKNGLPPHAPVLAEIPSHVAKDASGATKPLALLIGEGPGENEAREGRPFVGSTGVELDKQLARAGIPRHHCVVANATACKPPTGKTDAMLGRAAKCCSALFHGQVGHLLKSSTPTLAMGKWAAWAITNKASGVEHARGFVRENNLIITYHPTYAFFKNPWCKGDFEIDLHRFRRLIDGDLQATPIVVIRPAEGDLLRLRDEIKANDKDPTRARLKTIAFGTSNYAVAFTWPIVNGKWQLVREILANHAITKIFHNGYFFDLRVLKRYGIEVNNVTDTREIRRALVATSPLALRYLAQTYVDFEPWKELEDEK
jgi:uracil-DNA glycosylase family 4